MPSRLATSMLRSPARFGWTALPLLLQVGVVRAFSSGRLFASTQFSSLEPPQSCFITDRSFLCSTMMAMNWEPLPPREVSSREQRRRARVTMRSEASVREDGGEAANVDKKEPTHNPPAGRRPNRPGFNSYLKVILDDTTMDRLHGVAKRIQSKVQDIPKQTTENDDTGAPVSGEEKDAGNPTDEEMEESGETHQKAETNGTPPKGKNRKKKPLNFKPRSRASLHMTFFFGGEALCELPAPELQDWYNKVRNRLEKSNFILCSTETKQEGNANINDNSKEEPLDASKEVAGSEPETIGDYWFDVTDVRMFPPGRSNLIVAILEASPAWHVLHNDVREIAQTADSPGLNEVTAYSKEKWTAHITLGNIFGGGSKGQVRQAFTEILRDLSADLIKERDQEGTDNGDSVDSKSSEKSLFKATTFGIAMGGPIPEQVELDWNFIYKATRDCDSKRKE